MTDQQKATMVALIKRARRRKVKRAATEKAQADFIEFLQSNLQSWIANELRKRGVPGQDIQDALHEVLTRAVLEDLSKLRKPAAFLRFLKYKIQDVAKSYWKHPDFVELDDEQVDPTTCSKAEFRIEVAEALSRLPATHADALMLVDAEGYTYKAAAKALLCSVPSLKAKLEKARRKMRFLLSGASQNREGTRR